jgi:hypothetical protein
MSCQKGPQLRICGSTPCRLLRSQLWQVRLARGGGCFVLCLQCSLPGQGRRGCYECSRRHATPVSLRWPIHPPHVRSIVADLDRLPMDDTGRGEDVEAVARPNGPPQAPCPSRLSSPISSLFAPVGSSARASSRLPIAPTPSRPLSSPRSCSTPPFS